MKKPKDLIYKSTIPAIVIKSEYDWKNQRMEISKSKAGTYSNTRSTSQTRTSSSGWWVSDTSTDSISD